MRILFVLSTLPPVQSGGGAVAALLQLRALSERNEVHVVPVLDLGEPVSTTLSSLNIHVHPALTPHRSVENLAALSASIRADIIEVEAFSAGRCLRFGRRWSVPRVFRAYDATWDVLQSALQSPFNEPVTPLGRIAAALQVRRTLLRYRLAKLRIEEIRRASEYDEILVFSDRDKRLFAEVGLRSRVLYLPMGLPPARYARPPSDSLRLLFVGTFSYFPNVDAALHLVEDIVPRLPASLSVRVDVVGREPPARLMRHHDGHRIVVHGYVSDIQALYEETDVFVAPLRCGGGVKLKIMEALGKGLPVVTSRLGADGLDLQDGRDAIIADDPDGVVAALCRLNAQPQVRAALGKAARTYIERNHDVDRTTRLLESVYESIIRKHTPVSAAHDQSGAT